MYMYMCKSVVLENSNLMYLINVNDFMSKSNGALQNFPI